MDQFFKLTHYQDDGLYSCGHKHPTVRDAMNCLVPDGGCFIRAFDDGVCRSLNDREYIDFIEALESMPWRAPKKV